MSSLLVSKKKKISFAWKELPAKSTTTLVCVWKNSFNKKCAHVFRYIFKRITKPKNCLLLRLLPLDVVLFMHNLLIPSLKDFTWFCCLIRAFEIYSVMIVRLEVNIFRVCQNDSRWIRAEKQEAVADREVTWAFIVLGHFCLLVKCMTNIDSMTLWNE